MLFAGILSLLVIPLLFLPSTEGSINSTRNIEGQLMIDLLKDYNKDAKPTIIPQDKITVYFTFSLARIESLDEKKQFMTSFGWITTAWRDEMLHWEPAEYNGMTRIIIPAEKIWLPEMSAFNSIDEGRDLSLDTQHRVSVDSNGNVQWIPAMKWQTTCQVNLVKFPYDIQKCNVSFVNWMYLAELVDFELETDEVLLFTYQTNNEWSLKEAYANKSIMTVEGTPMKIPLISFTVILERFASYYTYNMIIPCVLMTLLSSMVFCLPCEAGEKMSLGITVLLSFSVVLLMISDITPRTGVGLPIMVVYIMVSMILTAFSLVITVGILNFHHHNPEKPPPRLLKRIVINGLGRIVCFRRENDNKIKDSIESRKRSKTSNITITDEKDTSHNQFCLPDRVQYLVEHILNKEKLLETAEQNKEQWQSIAIVLDRIFFIIYSAVIITFTANMLNIIQNMNII